MASPSIRCRICGHRIHPRAAKCPFCGKVYRKSATLFFAFIILVLIGIALLLLSFNVGEKQTRDAERQMEKAAKDAGLR